MFFDARKYDFSRVGRLKFNIKLFENQDASSLDKRTLDPDDFYVTIRYLVKLRKNIGLVDDIDHLGNRRVRAVGELMENQFRIGLVRMERAIKEKMSVYQEMSTAMPHDLVNAKPVMAAIREFFDSSQLSQFIEQANVELDEKGRIATELVNARKAGNFVLVSRDEIDYVDVSPKQLVSVAASLVPFLEHDDANRALMGANMQRQSVPLLRAEAPIVGTGMEGVTARDSGAVVLARRNGIIDSVDSERIIVRVEGEHHPGQLSREVGSDIYQ